MHAFQHGMLRRRARPKVDAGDELSGTSPEEFDEGLLGDLIERLDVRVNVERRRDLTLPGPVADLPRRDPLPMPQAKSTVSKIMRVVVRDPGMLAGVRIVLLAACRACSIPCSHKNSGRSGSRSSGGQVSSTSSMSQPGI
jgi:hypothetical protein